MSQNIKLRRTDSVKLTQSKHNLRDYKDEIHSMMGQVCSIYSRSRLGSMNSHSDDEEADPDKYRSYNIGNGRSENSQSSEEFAWEAHRDAQTSKSVYIVEDFELPDKSSPKCQGDSRSMTNFRMKGSKKKVVNFTPDADGDQNHLDEPAAMDLLITSRKPSDTARALTPPINLIQKTENVFAENKCASGQKIDKVISKSANEACERKEGELIEMDTSNSKEFQTSPFKKSLAKKRSNSKHNYIETLEGAKTTIYPPISYGSPAMLSPKEFGTSPFGLMERIQEVGVSKETEANTRFFSINQSDEKYSVLIADNREKINKQPGIPKFDFKTRENLTNTPIDIEFCTFDNQPENLFSSTNQIPSHHPSTDSNRVLPSNSSLSTPQNPFTTEESLKNGLSPTPKPILIQSQKTPQNPSFPINNNYPQKTDPKISSKEIPTKNPVLNLDLSATNLGGNKKKNVKFSGRQCRAVDSPCKGDQSGSIEGSNIELMNLSKEEVESKIEENIKMIKEMGMGFGDLMRGFVGGEGNSSALEDQGRGGEGEGEGEGEREGEGSEQRESCIGVEGKMMEHTELRSY
jgi:hypothetical protein